MAKHNVPVFITNSTSSVLELVQFMHRYDEDVYNTGELRMLPNNQTQVIGSATFWTGFLRTGYDYWWIQFRKYQGDLYTCKSNFYCYLESGDTHVILDLTTNTMTVKPAKSSNCKVRIYKSDDQLAELIRHEHDAEEK